MQTFSPFRLVAGGVLVAVIAFPLYFFALNRGADDSIKPARLLEAPAVSGRPLATGVAQGKLAPDFEISTPDGSRVRLSELRGRPVVMNFWAQWCTSCLSEMPEIKALQAERGIDTITVLAVNAGESLGEAQEFIDFLDAPFLYGLDIDLTVADAYGVYGLPLSVFIDSEGVIQALYVGHANRKNLETLTDAAIHARPAGELPVVLRIVSSIYRERTLRVQAGDAGRIIFQSRSLRCDPSYCATPAVDELRSLQGVLKATVNDGRLAVEFDQASTSASVLTDRLAALLSALPDPVYQSELMVLND